MPDDEEQGMRLTNFYRASVNGENEIEVDELASWYGQPVTKPIL